MVYARFTPALTNVTTNKVTQWDYGRILRIEGLKLPTAVRIDFGISGQQKSKSRIGITKDGVTDVTIPDSLLEQSKNLVAYVYVNDTKEGKTVRTINIPLEARAEPEEHDSPESKALFAEAIEVINDVAVRAEEAETSAKAHADSAKESLESTQQTSSNFNETAANAVKSVIDAGTSQIQAVNNTKTNALEAIQAEGAAQLEHIQAAGEVIVNTAAIAEQNAKNVLANAIKGNLSGEIVTADDVSPIEHEMAVKAKSKNLLSYPYYPFSVEKVGLTITANKDGSITLNGTSTASWNVGFFGSELSTTTLPAGTYTFSLKNGDNKRCYLVTGGNSSKIEYMFGTELTFNLEEEGIIGYCVMQIVSGATFDNLTVYPQLEEGNTPTEYTPYVDPATVNVRRCGKNLWRTKDVSYPFNQLGLTVDYDEKTNVYNFNGTSTSAANIYVVPVDELDFHVKKGETWHLTAEILGGSTTDADGGTDTVVHIAPIVATKNYNIIFPAKSRKWTFEQDTVLTKMYFYVYKKDIVFNNLKMRVQLEYDKATEFEVYKGETNYTPSSDGTVSGMMSTAQNMTILTDTEGIVIDCEYTKDTNKVIQKLADALGVVI